MSNARANPPPLRGSPQAAVDVGDARAARHGGRDWLSLALIDARNTLLQRLAAREDVAALRRAVHAGWYQEAWISRHVQRARGEASDAAGMRLAGIEPEVERWLDAQSLPPSPACVRAYLEATLEVTLELLGHSQESDEALHFFRLALLHEDRLGESLAEALGVGSPPARVQRDPLWLPAQHWSLGSPAGGLVPHNERWAHEVAVPDFEIDAQVVSWARFVEFAEDGGYDRSELWSAAGWDWLQAQGRRAPGGVEQITGGVIVERGGRLQRAPATQPVMHVSRHEAEAWCRWVGRRLPTEPEWELAASTAASRGFVWGDVFEWVAGSARAWPGAGAPGPGELDAVPAPGRQGVLRGASFATPRRRRHAKSRRFAVLERDTMFCGFRSCTV